MEDIAPAEATLSSQDFLASQRENRKLIFEKLQESQRKAPNSPGKKQAERTLRQPINGLKKICGQPSNEADRTCS